MTDVVVVGAGISGAAAALELAQRGLDVILLDRWGPAAMASGWSLAGIRQSARHIAELPLARAAVARWTTLHQRLGSDVRYRQDGNLRLARTEAEVAVLERLVAEQSAAGLDVVLLRGAEIQDLAPAVSPAVLAACHCPSDGHADPGAAVHAFVAAGVRLGVETRWGERALIIEVQGGRVVGLRTDRGRIACGRVVLAAGVFANELLEPLGLDIPIELRMVAAMRSIPLPPVLRQVIGVAGVDCAGRQQADGCFRVTGGVLPFDGVLQQGIRPAVSPPAASLAQLVGAFSAVIPAFAQAPIEAIWAGLVDCTPDMLPVLDHMPGVSGLVVGLGFSGHGFGLGPVTGSIIADLVMGTPSEFDLRPFRSERFAGWNLPPEPLSLHG